MADQQLQHLLRRAGFGSTAEELASYSRFTYLGAVTALLNYEQVPDEVDSKIGAPGYALVTATKKKLTLQAYGVDWGANSQAVKTAIWPAAPRTKSTRHAP